MKSRIFYDGVVWHGEILTEWELGRYWKEVIEPCHTKFGALLSLNLWIKRNMKRNIVKRR